MSGRGARCCIVSGLGCFSLSFLLCFGSFLLSFASDDAGTPVSSSCSPPWWRTCKGGGSGVGFINKLDKCGGGPDRGRAPFFCCHGGKRRLFSLRSDAPSGDDAAALVWLVVWKVCRSSRPRLRCGEDLELEESGTLSRPTSVQRQWRHPFGWPTLEVQKTTYGASPARRVLWRPVLARRTSSARRCSLAGACRQDGARTRSSRDCFVFLSFLWGLCVKFQHSCASRVFVLVCTWCSLFLS